MRRFLFLLLACGCLCTPVYMDIVYLNQTADGEGAVCLDGSSGAYYFAPANKENETKWVIHLCGGGMCMNDIECYYRSQSFVGSINLWPPILDWGGPVSSDPILNRDFFGWNRVFFPYCDGASFSGDVAEPAVVMNTTIYYRGHRILVAGLLDLLKTKGLDKATDVLLVGDSAGAMATYFHVDEVKSFMPDTVTRFKAAPFSGIFLDRPNVEGVYFWEKLMEQTYGLQDGIGNQRCFDAYPEEKYKCFNAQYVMEFIETPLFVLNSPYDTVALQCIIMGEPLLTYANGTGNCSAVPGSYECSHDISKCSSEQWDGIEDYAKAFREVVQNSSKLSKNGNGLFMHSCVAHDVEPGYGWDQFTVQGTVLRDALRDWFFSDNEPAEKHTYKDCVNPQGKECNPTCPERGSSSSSSAKSPSSGDKDGGLVAAVIVLSVLLFFAIIAIIGILIWHFRGASKPTSYSGVSDPLNM